MEQPKDILAMLDLMMHPCFCVQNNAICKVNRAAQGYLLSIGTDVRELLHTGATEYAQYQGGCLYLTLLLSGNTVGASVTRTDGYDIFLLEQVQDRAELQAMALAARELREPLATVMVTADRLFPLDVHSAADTNAGDQVMRINRGLYQMLRVIGNMSDAGRYHSGGSFQPETIDIAAYFRELFTKNIPLVERAGIDLHYAGPDKPIFCLADSEKLERALLNILSNALKFTPRGGHIDAKLVKTGSLLRLSIRDDGEGIHDEIQKTIYTRYLRQPSIEDSRYGIGLGMVLIRSAAALHGGTVLIDHPDECGTRVTFTIALRQSTEHFVRSPRMHIDYAGERDHSLIELSDALPLSEYDGKF